MAEWRATPPFAAPANLDFQPVAETESGTPCTKPRPSLF